jgi:SAM-dependent methyltransferase
MSTTTQTAPPDLAAVKARQQQMWASGDYAAVAARIVPMAEHLAAARYGCEVTGVDYFPGLLERARERAAAEGLEITFVEGDAEGLAFGDASFDAVLSCLGVMFAPDQERAAAELVRVCRHGGTIGLVNWTPGGFVGQLLKTVARHVPPPRRRAAAQPVGDPAAAAGAARRRGVAAGDHSAQLRVPVRLPRGVRRVLQGPLRPHPQGLRGAGLGRQGAALG